MSPAEGQFRRGRTDVHKLAVAGGDEGADGHGHIGDGHGLEPHFAGTGEQGVEETLTAQKLVFQPGHLLDVHGDGGGEAGHVAGVHHDLLPRCQVVLDELAVNFRKSHPSPGQALHDKALAAEEARPQLAAEVDGQVHRGLCGQEGVFLQDHLLAGPDVQGHDLAGEAGAKGDHALAPGGVDVLEHALS